MSVTAGRAHPSRNLRTIPAGEHSILTDLTCTWVSHAAVLRDCDPRILRPRAQDLITRPPRPRKSQRIWRYMYITQLVSMYFKPIIASPILCVADVLGKQIACVHRVLLWGI
ncbi:hypothetical protein AVEN_274419-1 [Araneus ventricosus]|uniref:Uncharacterized protein n=1 Tax=Araneus ventricosus TaxID=182803 RepID=A0A4Y2E6N8_ARAVE|nr:hypothetical protein AVEN_274419-1 [Araneus ventricosus]